MILLRPDCLVFNTAKGESIPCSAHDVTVELMGQSTKWIDKDMVEHAADLGNQKQYIHHDGMVYIIIFS